jgi:hypothetical protein
MTDRIITARPRDINARPEPNLYLVANLMDEFLRMENTAQHHVMSAQELAIQDLTAQVHVLTLQVRALREELHDADGIIYEANVRNWDLIGQVELLRENNRDLDYQLNGSTLSSPSLTVILGSSDSDTESEDLLAMEYMEE